MTTAESEITELYNLELDRNPDPAGLSGDLAYLADGGSLQAIAASIAFSPEAQGDIANLYNRELGRAPDSAGLRGDTAYLANFGSLQAIAASIANSAEASADINTLYQVELGRNADAAGLIGDQQALENGASLTAIAASIAGSAEAQERIGTTFQSATGHAPSATELAGYESELASRIPLNTVQAEIDEFSGGLPPQLPTGGAFSLITPETIGNMPIEFVYSLGSNDALITQEVKQSVAVLYSGLVQAAGVTIFDAATDIIQIQSSQAASFSALSFSQVGSNQTDVAFGGHNEIYLQGVVPSSLHSSNFTFV